MFTGIVHGTAKVESASLTAEVLRLRLALPDAEGLVPGASVSVGGCCLTAVEIDRNVVHFDVIAESLDRTTLGDLQPGDRVNVERAARFGDEIGGHVTSGHIWGIGEIVEIERTADNCRMRVRPPETAAPYILAKGYIAIDGASLTIGTVHGDGSFDLHLIPETLRITTLGTATIGTRVNIEVDAQTQAVVDTAERILALRAP